MSVWLLKVGGTRVAGGAVAEPLAAWWRREEATWLANDCVDCFWDPPLPRTLLLASTWRRASIVIVILSSDEATFSSGAI